MRTFALAAFLAIAPLHGQAALEPAEVAAFTAKAAGRYPEALDAFLALAADSRAGDLASAARAHVALDLAELLALRLGARDFRARMLAIAGRDGVAAHPELRDHALGMALTRAHAEGDLAGAISLQRELGALTSWWVCGPFDNERGAAFGHPLPAEQGFDPDATFDGKKRPIRWRPLPIAEAPGGVLELGSLHRPQEQVAVVLACALLAERDVDALLGLGCDGSFRVALDGRTLAAHDAQRAFARDQDRVLLPLRAGPNLLVITAMVQDGPHRLAARLRALDGAPLRDVQVSDAVTDLVAAANTTPRDVASTLPRSTLDHLLARAADGSAGDALRAATILLLEHPDEPSTRRDRALAEQAMRTVDQDQRWIATSVHAATLFVAGEAEEKDENPRRHAYESLLAGAATSRDGTQVETEKNLAELELEGAHAAGRAEELARQALGREPGFAPARLVLADALIAQRLTLTAERELLRAALPDARGDVSPIALRRNGDVLLRDGRMAEAEAAARSLCAVDADPAAHERLAELLLRRGATDEALAALRAAALLWPFATNLQARIARVHEALGDLDAAAAARRMALVVCPEDAEQLVELARIAARRGDRDVQRELLRGALELEPNRKTEARLLEFLEADQAPFHRAYEIDAEQALADRGTPPADAGAAHDSHFWVLRQVVVRAYRNGTASRYEHQIVRVLGERAVRQFARWQVNHDPGEQRARILSLRVKKADGRELRPKLGGAFAQLPPLEAGDVVDVRTRVDDAAPGFFGDYFGLVHSFVAPDGQPVARSELVAILDAGREYRTSSTQGAPDPTTARGEDGVTVMRWSATDLPRRLDEEHAPGWLESSPIARITTWRDWDAFAAWWSNLIKRQSEVTPAIRAKVAELTATCRSDDEKIAAIYRFVTTDVRYKAWEFGVHGYQPYDVGAIYERRHGDCKDKAILLNAMLALCGIEAHPVLIRAEEQRDTDDLTLPMVEQFNHCISWLPATADRPARFLDGTATLHSIETVPEMDQGAHVLVVRGEKAQLETVPYVAADANVSTDTVFVVLGSDGRGVASMVWERARNSDTPLRAFLANEPGRQAENLERMLQPILGRVAVGDVKTSALLDPSAPLRVELRVTAEDFASVQNGRLVIDGKSADEPLQRWTTSTERTRPLLLPVPSRELRTLEIELPPGLVPAALPDPVELDTRFGRFALRWTRDGRVLRMLRERTLRAPRIEAAEYQEFAEFASRADAADRARITIEKEDRR